jgi:phage terminase large subunit
MSAAPDSMADVYEEWCRSPLAFVRGCIGVEPDAWQVDALTRIERGCRRLALVACKGPGKSALLAWIILWWLVCKPSSKVVATSITGDNLRDCLWAELAKWIAYDPDSSSPGRQTFLQQLLTWSAERVVYNSDPANWFASARAWPRDANPEAQANTLAGAHSDHMLYVVDESGGVPRGVMAAAEAGLANASEAEGRTALVVQAGNPTDPDGPLFDAVERDRELWEVIHITSDPDDPNRTPRVDPEWAREQIRTHGRDNPWVMVNILGVFPPGATNALITLQEAKAATKVQVAPAEYLEEARILGVDVARFGDDASVAIGRQGRVAFKAELWRNLNTMQLAQQVVRIIDAWKPHAVFIDVTGVGAGVVDRCQELGYQVIGVNFGEASGVPKYFNKRSEMWGLMAEWIRRGGGALPDDPELIDQLKGPRYGFDGKSRLKLESKDEMKARGLASPDKGDALALTFAFPVARPDPVRDAQARLGISGGHQAQTEEHPYW